MFRPSAKWGLISRYISFSSSKEVTAVYDFNSAEKLIKVSEGFTESIENATDVTYQKLVYNYVIAYNELSTKYGMPEIGGEWLSQPTDEEIDAVDKVLNDYKNSSKELKTIVGKLIADGKLELITTSNGNTNNKVELSNSIDPSLIGGLKIVVNDTVFDNSVVNRINSLRQELINGKDVR